MKSINSKVSYSIAPAEAMCLGSVDPIEDLSVFVDQSAAERLFCEKSCFEFWEFTSLADEREDCIDRELVLVLLLGPVGAVRAARPDLQHDANRPEKTQSTNLKVSKFEKKEGWSSGHDTGKGGRF